ncbi:MAG: peptidoglycan editing factor PgeF [Chloroflexi bacterium]|nr:peptidoglycan editing factor PgeF [Chloroflexota bacterium]
MPFHQVDSIRFFSFDIFDQAGIPQAIFTRQGGVSPSPWKSLNAGLTVGDESANVTENRRRSFAAMGKDLSSMYDVWQVHSNKIVCADAPRDLRLEILKADAILTYQDDVTLYMRFADCVPILIADPRRRVVGIVHAGWIGTVNRVLEAAIQRLVSTYSLIPSELLAGIGPSICVDHYPVGPDVAAQVRQSFGDQADRLLLERDGKIHFDLWKANRLILEEAGVKNIEMANLCTACHTDDWYSHRAEHGLTGRFGALIAIK